MAGRISRFLKMSAMTTGIAGRHLGAKLSGVISDDEAKKKKLQKSYQTSGQLIAKTLAELKGPVMKFGQMASIQSGFLPAALTAPLASLRQNAVPEAFEAIKPLVEQELEAPLERKFTYFEEIPFAAASIGQVHRATTNAGLDVAVKVQYPGMNDFVDADVASLTMTLKAMGVASGQRVSLKQVAAEFKQNLTNELDFELEAINQMRLQKFHQERHSFITVPMVVCELSSKRVLTTSYVPGDSLEQAAKYAPDIRDLIGQRLLEMLYQQIFFGKILHADPNPSNYAFTADGNIILYDFGCVKHFDETETIAISQLLKGLLKSDRNFITEGLRGVGALRINADSPDDEFFRLLYEIMELPLHSQKPFDAENSNMHLLAMSYMPKFRKYRKQLSIPAKLLLLQRVNVGCYGNLRKLKANVLVRKLIQETLDEYTLD